MKIMSFIVSILILSFTMCYGMDPTSLYELRRTGLIPVTGANLDSLPQDAFLEINYCLNDMQSINAIRCVNRSCHKNAPSQAELNENFIRAVPKALENDDAKSLHHWKRCGAHPEKIFLNFLDTDEKDFARFVYCEFGLSANNALELAAKLGSIKVTKLLIFNYYADNTNRPLTMAVMHGHKDLANVLIKDHRASLLYVRKVAARNGNINLFDKFIKFCPPEKFSLSDELMEAAIGGHITLFKKIITDQYSLASYKLLPETARNCAHSDLENCGHKAIIKSLISAHQLTNIHEALVKAAEFGREGMVKWLITQYRFWFDKKIIRRAITVAETKKYIDLASWLKELLTQMTNTTG